MARYVEDIMQKEVVTVTPDTPVKELLRNMVAAQISGVPVVTEDGEIVGVVSATDVVRLGAESGEIPRGDLSLEPLAFLADEDDEPSAPFFMVPGEWSYPTEGQAEAMPDALFEGYAVSDIMTPAVFTVRPRESVEDAAKFLLRGRIHRALVVEDGQLKGIVTAFDLLRAFVDE